MSQEMRRLIPRKYYNKHYSEITFKTSFGNCVLKALQNRKWRQIDTTGWDLQWSEKERVNDVFEQGLKDTQRCNHFRLWSQLCRKDMMIKNIRKHKRFLQKQKNFIEEDWDFLPLTYFLPSQYIMFAEEFKKKGGLWIMKPTSKCQGQGIFLIDKLSQVAPFRHKTIANPQNSNIVSPLQTKPPVPNFKGKKDEKKEQKEEQSQNDQDEVQQKQQDVQQSESYLIQQYISKPLLFGSKKFDLRIYCLCTNYSQLTTWLYRSGFARFTHEPYNTQNIDNLQSHLTNVEIQKHSDNYDQIRGGKWLINKFKHYLLSKYEPSKVDYCFTEIQNIIIRSLQSVQKNILPSKNSFELYGYDFMIDANLKPWLIEINGGPSMTANTDFDCRLKCGLIDDVLSIIDLEGMLKGTEITVGGFDLIMDKGVKVVHSKYSDHHTLLGAKNERKKVMRHIYRQFLKEKETVDKRQNLQKVVKKKVKNEQNKKEKLLPNFYYKKKMEEVIDQVKQNLVSQLMLMERNQNSDSHPERFVPLHLIEQEY